MIRPRTRSLVTAMAMAAALLAAGCSSSGAAAGALAKMSGPPEKPDITVAAVPSFDAAGLYIAQQRGFFAQEGLHVTIVPAVSGSTVLADQLAGKYDVTFGGYVTYILAMAQGRAKMHLLAPGTVMTPTTQMILVPPDSAIQSPAQLAGKKVGVNVQGNIASLLIDSLLQNYALPQGSVKFVPVPLPQMAKALQQHKVDAAWLPEPYVTAAEETTGARPLVDADTGLATGLPIVGYACTQAWLHKYPNTAAAFTRAILRGQQLASEDSAAVSEASARYVGIPLQTASIVPTPQFQLKADPAAIQRISNLMLQFGFLPQGFSTSQFLSG